MLAPERGAGPTRWHIYSPPRGAIDDLFAMSRTCIKQMSHHLHAYMSPLPCDRIHARVAGKMGRDKEGGAQTMDGQRLGK